VEWNGTVGASPERIRNKMGAAQCGFEEHKKYTCGAKQEVNRSLLVLKAKVYSWLSRARGLKQCISFFLLIIGFKEYK
jgi:hypothetical protein